MRLRDMSLREMRLPDMRLAIVPLACAIASCGAPEHARPDSRDPVGVYVSSPRTFTTSSYWIEGPDGVVMIDTQFLPSEGLRALEAAERATGKRVVLAIVLHANPDKFNGAHALAERGVRVITSEQVRALVPGVHALRHRWFAPRYPGEYPDAPPELESFGDATTTLRAAGLDLTLHVLGPGCSDAHVVVEWEGHVFAGDLVANAHHSWLELGHTDAWLARLDELAALTPRRVHPGRGPSGGPELLASERDYITRVVDIVRASEPTEPVAPGALDALRARIEAIYPDYGFAVFLRVGLPAVHRRLAAERADEQ